MEEVEFLGVCTSQEMRKLASRTGKGKCPRQKVRVGGETLHRHHEGPQEQRAGERAPRVALGCC